MPKLYLVLLALLLGMSFLPMRFSIRIYREPNKVNVTASVFLWFIPIRITVKNPLTKLVYNFSRNRFWEKEAPLDIRAKEVSWKRIASRVKLLNRCFFPLMKAANNFFHRISRPVKITHLGLSTELGLGDAADTAVASGLLWSLKGTLLSMLSYYFDVRKVRPVFLVIPNYSNPDYLKIDYSCIFEFRLGHIIIVIYQLLRSFSEIHTILRRVSQ